MSWFAFFLIITSATFHATWNLLAKKNKMTLPFLFVLCLVSTLTVSNVFFWTPVNYLELPGKFWLSLCITLIGDALYWIGLMTAYKLMDMSSAYPMMRALPILLTAAATWILGFGTSLSWLAIAGFVLIFLGCMSMPLASFREWNWKSYFTKNMFFVLVAAAGTTWYTIMDSQTQKILCDVVKNASISAPVLSLSYTAIREVMLALLIGIPVFVRKESRSQLKNIWTTYRWSPVIAGISGALTYGLVLMAMNYVDNVSYVQVFRQVGLLIGMAGAVIFLKEKVTVPKVIGGILIVTGLILSVLKME